MLHSGSRNLGLKVAAYYHTLALNKGIVPDGVKELAYFKFDSPEGQEYFEAMNFCLDFAMENRTLMREAIFDIIKSSLPSVEGLYRGDIHHNFASVEEHFGKRVVVHRKGATKASKGLIGIIPGSMGANSYIVQGKGNRDSFESCSHGAGRKMSRTRAKKEISVEEYKSSLSSMGLEVSDREIHLDEAPGAYKPIEEVMKNQEDLIKVLVTLKPYQLPAIKG